MKELMLILLVYLVSGMKLVHDVYRYKDDLNRNAKYGKLYHIFGFLVIPTALLISLIGGISLIEYGVYLLAFTLMYGFIISVGFNKLTGKGSNYIGNTDGTDIMLNRIFRIVHPSEEGYESLTAKQKQINNFKRTLVLGLRFVLFALGHFIILEYL